MCSSGGGSFPSPSSCTDSWEGILPGVMGNVGFAGRTSLSLSLSLSHSLSFFLFLSHFHASAHTHTDVQTLLAHTLLNSHTISDFNLVGKKLFANIDISSEQKLKVCLSLNNFQVPFRKSHFQNHSRTVKMY